MLNKLVKIQPIIISILCCRFNNDFSVYYYYNIKSNNYIISIIIAIIACMVHYKPIF